MEKLLNSSIVSNIFNILKDDSLCLTGGAVRDQLLGKAHDIIDYDFATKLKPEEVISRLETSGLTSYFRAIRRGTIYVNVEGVRVDITTFRNPEKENEYVDTIEQDLAARDFTINAIALQIKDGKLIDPYDGQKDLKDNIVRSVRAPVKRFLEDPHRIIRLIRFSVCEGRQAEENTWKAAKALSKYISQVAWERLGMEFYKIMSSSNPVAGIRGMLDLDILFYILPELYACIGLEQNKHHLYDVYEHTLRVLENAKPYETVIRTAALFHDVGKQDCVGYREDGSRTFLGHGEKSVEKTREALTRLKFTNFFIDRVAHLVDTHMIDTQQAHSKKALRKIIRKIGIENLEDWLALKGADIFGGRPAEERLKLEWEDFQKKLEEVRFEPIQTKENFLQVRGQDLLDMGFEQGKLIGDILKYLEEVVLEDPSKNTRETLLSLVTESPYHLKIKLPLN